MTRKLPTLIFVVALCVVAAMAQATAAPATPPAPTGPAPAKIGIINTEAAIMATNEGQRDAQALNAKYEPKDKELQTQNSEIEKMKSQLQTQGDKLNEAARADLVKNIELKTKNIQRAAEDYRADYNNEANAILGRIAEKMRSVLDKYAKENGYAVILDVGNQQTSVVWAAQATDITKPIVDAYNAQSGVAAPPASAGTKPAVAPKPAAPRPTAGGTTPAKKP